MARWGSSSIIPIQKVTFSEILVQLDVLAADDAIRLPQATVAVPVVKGGPVETGRGFVLHSDDYFVDNSTLPIDDGIALTATLDVLRAIAEGNGPEEGCPGAWATRAGRRGSSNRRSRPTAG